MNLLVIDDDIDIHNLLKKLLNPLVKVEFRTALPPEASDLHGYDLIILDLMLEAGSTLPFLHTLKEQEPTLLERIILLTGKGSEEDEVEAHRTGTRDYVKKPFNAKVFSALIDKHLMALKQNTSILKYGPFTLDIHEHTVTLENQKNLELTSIEYKILRMLIESRGRVVTRERLMTDVWDMNDETQTRTVDMHISTLRKKLGHFESLLKTRRGLGYLLLEKHE